MAGPSSRSSATGSTLLGPAISCRAVRTAEERAAHLRIRHEVFVREQGLFGAGGDGDAHDGDPAAILVIGLAGEDICGTVRLYPMPSRGEWKGDRLAVLSEYRHLGLGAPLVRFAVATAAARGGQRMEAFIQPANVRFFSRLGWQPTGGLVGYAGIPHQRMVIDLQSAR